MTRSRTDISITPLTYYYLIFTLIFGAYATNPPNIVIIVADDMGSYDLSYRGSNQFTTPNIDALAYNGIILNRHYTGPYCTPSRASLLTGQYAAKIGMQGEPIKAGQDEHLPFDIQTLPQLLKGLGYHTHLVGKWHLGAARRKDTPVGKGFDTFFGYWNGYVGYFNYEVNSSTSNKELFRGFDLKENFTDSWKDQGKYATDLFTEKSLNVIEKHDKGYPLFLMVSHLAVHTGEHSMVEIRNEENMNRRFGYIENLERRRYADALYQLDKSVGKIVKKLKDKDLLNNSVVIFLSDNGAKITGDYHNGGSNYPFRGQKHSLHDGGVHNAAVIFSPLLNQQNYVHDGLMHISDWLPTLYNLAGGSRRPLSKNIDGVDQWESLSHNRNSSRKEALLNIDEINLYSGIIGYEGRYKLLNGTTINGKYDDFHPEPLQYSKNYDVSTILNSPVNQAIKSIIIEPKKELNEDIVETMRKTASSSVKSNLKCKDEKKRKNPEICEKFCLFDLQEDPCETENLIDASDSKGIAEELKQRLGEFWKEILPQENNQVDLNSNPERYNGTWCTWLDDGSCVKTAIRMKC